MILVIILVVLALGAIAGWRAAVRFTDKKMIEENLFLRNHVEQLKENVRYYYEQSNLNREIQNTTIENHNSNLKKTLDNILVLLQNQPKENLKEGEKENIENIIKTIKTGFSSSHVE